MKRETVDEAIRVGYTRSYADMPRVISRCEFAIGVIGFVEAIQNSTKNPIKKYVLGWVARWVKEWREGEGCHG